LYETAAYDTRHLETPFSDENLIREITTGKIIVQSTPPRMEGKNMLAMMWKPILGSMVLAAVVIVVSAFLAAPQALVLFAVLLGLTAGVYIGFGLADGRSWEQGIELLVGLLFFAVAAAGVWVSPLVIAGGFLAHAVWGMFHQPRLVGTQVVMWYPPIGAMFDMIMAGYIAARWTLL
jgi:hypothetical protein